LNAIDIFFLTLNYKFLENTKDITLRLIFFTQIKQGAQRFSEEIIDNPLKTPVPPASFM
jgi:hypothetical protein